MEKAHAAALKGTTPRPDAAPARPGSRSRQVPGGTFYDFVAVQLTKLVGFFGLSASRATIGQAYDLVCRESLAFPIGRRPPDFSRINDDGTPFQFALTARRFAPPLQFLGEAGVPGSCTRDRLLLSRERIRALAALFDVTPVLSRIEPMLDDMVPAGDPDLQADSSGVIWLGAGFRRDEPPRLKIYLNARWGETRTQWARLGRFASALGRAAAWDEIAQRTAAMEPLGAALTLGGDGLAAGRNYLSAYGKPLTFYEELAGSVAGAAFRAQLGQFAEALLRDDCRYPTRSVVCSFGFDPDGEIDFKIEMCGHCAFANDDEARQRCIDWLARLAVDPAVYLQMLEVLSDDRLDRTRAHLHCYVGLGRKRNETYSTFYFKPSIARP
jgi:hypothetical protein